MYTVDSVSGYRLYTSSYWYMLSFMYRLWSRRQRYTTVCPYMCSCHNQYHKVRGYEQGACNSSPMFQKVSKHCFRFRTSVCSYLKAYMFIITIIWGFQGWISQWISIRDSHPSSCLITNGYWFTCVMCDPAVRFRLKCMSMWFTVPIHFWRITQAVFLSFLKWPLI